VVPVPAAARAACLDACSPGPPGLAAAPALLACCLGPAEAGDPAPGTELAAGGAVRTLLLALNALGVAALLQPAPPAGRPALATALRLGPGWQPLGLVAAGHPTQT
jgi:nitroreductase